MLEGSECASHAGILRGGDGGDGGGIQAAEGAVRGRAWGRWAWLVGGRNGEREGKSSR